MIVVPELPKIYAPGNFWLEGSGKAMAYVTRDGVTKYYYNQYEVDAVLKEIYKKYAEIEAKYCERL